MLNDTDSARYLSMRRTLIEQRFPNLNDMQRLAALTTEGPLLILAGAGSGKTTVLIHRIANLLLFGGAYHSRQIPFHVNTEDLAFLQEACDGRTVEDARMCSLLRENPPRPWEIMAITFTNKAAGELRARLASMLGEEQGGQVMAATFHSVCMRMLRSDIERLGYKSGFVIYDSDDSQRVVKDVLKVLNLDDKMFQPRTVLSMMGEAKDRLETPAEMMERVKKADDYYAIRVARIYEAYQNRLREANALDFDDIITMTVRLFEQNPDVLEKYQRRYRYLMVDEYQDTNRSQYRLVALLAGARGNLCVVGDDDQSIYRFRGATIENILSFEQQFEGAKVVRLEQNYRSTQNILNAANAVIAHNQGRKGKTLWTAAGSGAQVVLCSAEDEREEAGLIADAVAAEVRNGRKYGDCALLYRLNAQSATLETAMVSAGIPYKVVGGTRFFDRKEIRDMVAYLSVLQNPADVLRLSRIINEPKRGIGDATVATAQEISGMVGVGLFDVLTHAGDYAPLQRKAKQLNEFAGIMTELVQASQTMPLPDLLEKLVGDTGYRAMLLTEGVTGQTRMENIEELKTTMQRYTNETEEPSLGGFLEEVALYTDLDNYDPDADAVTLMTLHAAKGLEFPVVFIPGMEEGIFPSSRAFSDPEQLEEERRLAYVGITRAREHLTLLTARRRMLFGQTLYGKPSRFILEIPTSLIEQKGRRTTAQTPTYSRAHDAVPSQRQGVDLKPTVTAESMPTLVAGDRVTHRVFGEGIIRRIAPMGGDLLLEIDFDRVGAKKIMAAYARLSKV
ncbi:MAG: 3'-5' exonuclease [Oscillospiraceae bacterium]